MGRRAVAAGLVLAALALAALALAALGILLFGRGRVTLPAGRHPGPGTVASDRTFRGAGAGRTTLFAKGPGPVVVVPKGRRVVLADLAIAPPPSGPSLRVLGTLVLRRVVVRGGGAAVRVDGGHLDAEGLTVTRARSAVELVDGASARVDGLTAREVRLAAVLAGAGTSLVLRHATVDGGSYGLTVRPGARVDVRGLVVHQPHFAGVGITGGAGRLADVTVVGPDQHGGVLVSDLHAPLTLRDLAFHRVGEVGLQVVRGKVTVDGIEVSGVAVDRDGGLGNALLVEAADAEVRHLSVAGTAGAAVAVIGGDARIEDGAIAGSGDAGLQAWRRAKVTVRDVSIAGSRGPGILADEGARIDVAGGALAAGKGGLAADCDGGGQVTIAAGTRILGRLGRCGAPAR